MKLPILLITDGVVHPPLAGRRLFERFLRGLPGYTFQRVKSLEALPGMDLKLIRAMALYFQHKEISPSALDALDGYVQGGGGIIAVHSVSASFKQESRFYEILGGRFDHHGPVEPVTLQPQGSSTLFAGVPAFTITDELYRHEVNLGNTVHFIVEVDGEREPFVWTRTHGAGRVMYLAAGHTSEVMADPQIREILRRGLAWACGNE